MNEQEKFTPQTEQPESSETEPWKNHMACGSKYFENVTSNNHTNFS